MSSNSISITLTNLAYFTFSVASKVMGDKFYALNKYQI